MMFLIGFPKSKNTNKRNKASKNQKQEEKEDKLMQRKNKWNIMIGNKTKQEAEQQKPKNKFKE